MNITKFSLCVILCLGLINELNATSTSEMEEFRREIQELKAATAAKLMQADQKIQSLQSEMDGLKRENLQLKELHTNKRLLLNNPFAEKSAFSASLGQHAMNLGNYQTIVFDNVFTNDLKAYSPLSGVFTAPMNGTYFFTTTVMSHSNQYLETDICLNGNTLVKTFSKDSSHEQGTNSVVVALTTGDMVWVRHHGTEGLNAYGYGWTSFSGFMI